MTPEQAEWVREHVWLPGMRKIFKDLPSFYLACPCESHWGPCSGRLPQHDTCHIGIPLVRPETNIGWPWDGVASFAGPYRHPTASATGWHYTSVAQVWLADRRCAWWCECDCGHPYVPAHAPNLNPTRPIVYERVALFDLRKVMA